MSTKAIALWVIVIIVIAIGGYFMFFRSSVPSNTNPQQPAATSQSATSTPEQVQGQDKKVGTGKEATPGSLVSVLYVGKLSNGTVFDSSAAHGNQPLKFVLGAQGLIPGFQVGVNGMKEGGERVIQIPPSLGYGVQDVKDPTGKVIIPANSTLLFDIKLVKVEAAPATTTPAKTQ